MIRRKMLLAASVATTVSFCFANPVTPVPSAQEEKTTPVLEINGKTATYADLTSFSLFLENTEGRGFASSQELIDEYIITQLADDIPSTIPQAEKKSVSPYGNSMQRGMLKRAFQEEVRKTVEVTREEMEDWVKKHELRYTQPEKVHAYHIFMETKADSETSSPEKVRERLLKVKAEADKGTSFSQLAEKHSEAASSKKGGEIGKISRRMPIGPLNKPMNLTLENAFFSLEKGQVSDVVDTSHGLHLLYAADRETTKTSTLDELVQSGVLPGSLTQDKLTSAVREAVQNVIEKYNGEVKVDAAVLNADRVKQTVLFVLDGKEFTVRDFEKIYGERFLRAAESSAGSQERFTQLAQQALEDEAMILAAVDKKLDKNPEFAEQFDLLEKRQRLQEVLLNYYTSRISVSEEEVKKEYEAVKNNYLQPETEGWLVKISGNPATTATADIARAREHAKEFADKLNETAVKEFNIESLKKIAVPEDVATSFTQIKRHNITDSSDFNNRVFDQVTGRQTENNTVSPVMPRGEDFYFAYLKERHAGNPAPYEALAPNLKGELENKQFRTVRKNLISELEKSGKVKMLEGAKELYSQPQDQ